MRSPHLPRPTAADHRGRSRRRHGRGGLLSLGAAVAVAAVFLAGVTAPAGAAVAADAAVTVDAPTAAPTATATPDETEGPAAAPTSAPEATDAATEAPATAEAADPAAPTVMAAAAPAAAGLPTAPRNVAVTTLADGGVRISWAAPAEWGSGGGRYYHLQWQGVQMTTGKTTENIDQGSFQVGVPYPIVVSAATSDGSTAADPVVYTRTGRPQAPTAVSAEPAGPGSVRISWTAPTNTGGLPITRYDAFRRPVGSSSWIPGPSAIAGSARDALAVGLTIGVEYEFMVVASNSVGDGPESAPARTTVIDVPQSPTIQSVTAGDGCIDLSWNAAPGADSYVIEMNDGSGFSEVPATVSGTSASVTGLTNGKRYTVRVGALNAAGRSASDSVQAEPRAPEVPGAPQSLQGSPAGSERVQLTWQPPTSDGRSPLTSYVVERRGLNQPWVRVGEATGTSLQVAQEAGSTVRYRVSAVNAIGQGPVSETTTIAAIRTPDAPQDVTAAHGDGSVTLTWSAVPPALAAPVDGYVVEQRVAGGDWGAPTAVTVDGTSATISGLADGVEVDLRVRATNAAGAGAASAPVTVTPVTRPGAPTGLIATAGAGRVALTWTAPDADGGASVSGYVVEQLADGIWVTAARTSGATTSTTVPGLANGTEVALRVRAVNRVGAGAATAPVRATPFTTSDPVTSLRATPSSLEVSLVWAAPAFDGGSPITSYVVEQRTGGGAWMASTTVVSGTSAVVSALANGQAYDFRVVPVTAAGRGSIGATASTTPFTVPGTPADVRAVARNGAIAVAWLAPAFDGGAGVERYVLEIRAAGAPTWTEVPAGAIDRTTAIVPGLENGRSYELRVSAVNAAGTGHPTAPVTITPITVADAPTNLVATPGDGRVTLSWTAPASTGGAVIDDYVVEQLVGGEWTVAAVATAGTSTDVTGLTNGKPATFRVAADTAAGVGARSATADAVPFRAADAPSGLTAAASDGRIALSWHAPADLGGRTLIGYVVEQRVGGGEWTQATPTTRDTSATMTGLTNGVGMQVRVAAVTADAGVGAFTAPVQATPFAFAPTVVGPTGAALAGTTLRAGEIVTVTANGLPPGARVAVELHSEPLALASVPIGADGVLRAQVRIPAEAPLGGHDLVVRLTGADVAFSPSVTPFVIEAAATVPHVDAPVPSDPSPSPTSGATVGRADGAGDGSRTAPTGRAGALATTGASDVGPTLLAGVTALFAGVLVFVRRRLARRTR